MASMVTMGSCSIGAPVGLEVQTAGGLPAVRGEGHDLLVVPGVRLLDDLAVADVEADVSGVAVADLGEHEIIGGQPGDGQHGARSARSRASPG